MNQIKTTEHNEQATFIDAVLWQYRNDPSFLRPLFFSVPNGAFLGGRSALQYAKLKKEGFRNGVSDILYLQPRGMYSYFSLEMKTQERKRERGGGLSEDQRGFLQAVTDAGGLSAVCYGADEAIEAFGRYMALVPLNIPLAPDAVKNWV